MSPASQRVPEVSPEEKVTAELIKRIRKLRWIGLEADADLVRAKLTSHPTVPADSVIAAPRDTD